MYLIAFSYFLKSNIIMKKNKEGEDMDWVSIYAHTVDFRLVSVECMSKYIKSIFSSTSKINSKIYYSFPICVKRFKNKDELNKFKRNMMLSNNTIKNIKSCNKRYNISISSNYSSKKKIRMNRLVKANQKEDNVFCQTMESNKLTLQAISLLMENDNVAETEEYSHLRTVDKYINKYIQPDSDNKGLYNLRSTE